jgi:Raf kinase inhibitor-like YbhB/YbcL family protein
MKHSSLRLIATATSMVIVFFSNAAQAQAFEASSADIANGKTIAQKFVFNGVGCTGENISPAITWKNAPAGTKSFVVMARDLDATNDGDAHWHWIVIDVAATTTQLVQDAGGADGKKLLAGARHTVGNFGTTAWRGPCPPVGNKPHRYDFTVFAMKVKKFDDPAHEDPSGIAFLAHRNSLAKASFTGLYGR